MPIRYRLASASLEVVFPAKCRNSLAKPRCLVIQRDCFLTTDSSGKWIVTHRPKYVCHFVSVPRTVTLLSPLPSLSEGLVIFPASSSDFIVEPCGDSGEYMWNWTPDLISSPCSVQGFCENAHLPKLADKQNSVHQLSPEKSMGPC